MAGREAEEAAPARDAAREFAAVWGEHARAARHYRAATLALAAALAAAVFGLVGVSRFVPQPIFVRVDAVGRADVVQPTDLYWQRDPADPVTKHFLRRFVQLHSGRLRARVQDDFTQSLYFLSRAAGAAAYESAREELAAVASGAAPQKDVANIVLRIYPGAEPPHRAEATYELIEAGRGGARRTHWTAALEFDFVDAENPDFARVNPIGLVITHLRVDEVAAE